MTIRRHEIYHLFMTYLNGTTIEQKIAVGINIRIGVFLAEQRKLKGRSVRTVARKIKIKRSHLKKWEAGKSSLPCQVFLKIVSLYGKDAYRLASELDLQLQLEKYHRIIEQEKVQRQQPRKLPAVIWATHRRDKLAS